MKRPSRGLLAAAFVALLLAVAAFGTWMKLRAPNRWAAAPPPDAWMKEGAAAGDVRTSPDGPPVADWVCVGTGSVPMGGRKDTPFVALVRSGEEMPSRLNQWMDRLSGDPMRSWRDRNTRNLYRSEDPVVTPSGRWWRYSSRWWKGAKPPAVPGK